MFSLQVARPWVPDRNIYPGKLSISREILFRVKVENKYKLKLSICETFQK